MSDEFYKAQKKQLEEFQAEIQANKPRVLLAGETGAGKSSMIKAFFDFDMSAGPKTGTGKPVTQKCEEFHPPGKPIVLVDTKGLERDQSTEKQLFQDIKHYQDNEKLADRIQVCWYFVNGQKGRWEDNDTQTVTKMQKNFPVLIILNKIDGVAETTTTANFDAIQKECRGLNVKIFRCSSNPHVGRSPDKCTNFIGVGEDQKRCESEDIAKTPRGTWSCKCGKQGGWEYPADIPAPCCPGVKVSRTNPKWFCCDCGFKEDLSFEPIGTEELCEATNNALPESARCAWAMAQSISEKQMQQTALGIIFLAATASGAAGLSPIPFLDTLLVLPIQCAMQNKIFTIYWLFEEAELFKKLSITASALQVACCIGDILKCLPLVGTVIGSAVDVAANFSVVAAAGLVTLMVAKLIHKHKKQNGHFDLDEVLHRFKEGILHEMVKSLLWNRPKTEAELEEQLAAFEAKFKIGEASVGPGHQ